MIQFDYNMFQLGWRAILSKAKKLQINQSVRGGSRQKLWTSSENIPSKAELPVFVAGHCKQWLISRSFAGHWTYFVRVKIHQSITSTARKSRRMPLSLFKVNKHWTSMAELGYHRQPAKSIRDWPVVADEGGSSIVWLELVCRSVQAVTWSLDLKLPMYEWDRRVKSRRQYPTKPRNTNGCSTPYTPNTLSFGGPNIFSLSLFWCWSKSTMAWSRPENCLGGFPREWVMASAWSE